MAASPTDVPFNTPAPPFSLPATDGRTYTLDDIAGRNGTVIVFICNHCPYVKAVIERMVTDAKTLMAEGIGFAAICSNDARSYPEDSLENWGQSEILCALDLVEAFERFPETGFVLDEPTFRRLDA